MSYDNGLQVTPHTPFAPLLSLATCLLIPQPPFLPPHLPYLQSHTSPHSNLCLCVHHALGVMYVQRQIQL